MVVGASIALATKLPSFDGVAVGEPHPGRAAVLDHDLIDVGPGDHRAAARLDQPPQRER